MLSFQSGSTNDDAQEGPNKFMLLCDSVHSSLALLNIALEEVYTHTIILVIIHMHNYTLVYTASDIH